MLFNYRLQVGVDVVFGNSGTIGPLLWKLYLCRERQLWAHSRPKPTPEFDDNRKI